MTLDMGLGESAQMLQNAARDYLSREYNLDRARAAERSLPGFDQQLWKGMQELGWLSLATDTDTSLVDACALLEELGQARAITPFKESVVAVGWLARGSTEPAALKVNDALANGTIYTSALSVQFHGAMSGRPQSALRGVRNGSSVRLSGRLILAPFIDAADFWLAAVSTGDSDDLLLVLVPRETEGVVARRIRTVSPVPQYEVAVHDAVVSTDHILSSGEEAAEGSQRAFLVAACAEMLGGCAKVLDQTTNYAKDRVQFGQPIGSFQAIQNRFASLVIDLDITRYVIYDAAWRIGAGEAASEQLGYLGSWAGQAFERMCVEGHHINGAMSVTEEYGLEFISRQALGTRLLLGDPSDHKDALLASVERKLVEA